jgi:hypothetical protein
MLMLVTPLFRPVHPRFGPPSGPGVFLLTYLSGHILHSHMLVFMWLCLYVVVSLCGRIFISVSSCICKFSTSLLSLISVLYTPNLRYLYPKLGPLFTPPSSVLYLHPQSRIFTPQNSVLSLQPQARFFLYSPYLGYLHRQTRTFTPPNSHIYTPKLAYLHLQTRIFTPPNSHVYTPKLAYLHPQTRIFTPPNSHIYTP